MTIDTTKGIAGLKGALRYVRAYRDQVFVVKRRQPLHQCGEWPTAET